MMVTLCIIQMSLAERATNEAAIKSNSIVSLLHGPGIMIPNNLERKKKQRKRKINYWKI